MSDLKTRGHSQLQTQSPVESDSDDNQGDNSLSPMINRNSNASSTSRKISIASLLALSLLSILWIHQDQLMIIVSGNLTLPSASRQQTQSSHSYMQDVFTRRETEQLHRAALPDLTFTLRASHAAAYNNSSRASIQDHALPPHRPFCKRSQVIDGQWSPVLLDKAPYITPTVHLRCYPKEYYEQSPYPSWEWIVKDQGDYGSRDYKKAARSQQTETDDSDCIWTQWSASSFCAATENQHILIAGDSLSWEHYASLIQLLGVQTHQGFQHQSKAFGVPIGQSVCKGKTKIWYFRDDKLEQLPSVLDEFVPHVLVMNRGAHYMNDTILMTNLREKTFPSVQQWQKRCRQAYGDTSDVCIFAWRTSVPGHPNCNEGTKSAFTRPNNDLSEVEEAIKTLSNYNERSINYHWYDYQHQNELVLDLLREMFGSHEDTSFDVESLSVHDSLQNYMVLDAYYLNVRRPDEHRAHQGDCLHNCYPGKMDVYSQLLLHFMLAKRSNDQRQNPASKKSKMNPVVVSKTASWWGPVNVSTTYDKEGWMDILYGDKDRKDPNSKLNAKDKGAENHI